MCFLHVYLCVLVTLFYSLCTFLHAFPLRFFLSSSHSSTCIQFLACFSSMLLWMHLHVLLLEYFSVFKLILGSKKFKERTFTFADIYIFQKQTCLNMLTDNQAHFHTLSTYFSLIVKYPYTLSSHFFTFWKMKANILLELLGFAVGRPSGIAVGIAAGCVAGPTDGRLGRHGLPRWRRL